MRQGGLMANAIPPLWQQLVADGLVEITGDVHIAPTAMAEPADVLGDRRPIRVFEGVRVGHFALIYGGVELGPGVVVEEHVVVGKPEFGYAVGCEYDGSGRPTHIGPGVILRGGA